MKSGLSYGKHMKSHENNTLKHVFMNIFVVVCNWMSTFV